MGAYLNRVLGGVSELTRHLYGTYTTLKLVQTTLSLAPLQDSKAIEMLQTTRAVIDGLRIFHEPKSYFWDSKEDTGLSQFQIDRKKINLQSCASIFTNSAFAVLNAACTLQLADSFGLIKTEQLSARLGKTICLFKPVAKLSLNSVIKYSYVTGLAAATACAILNESKEMKWNVTKNCFEIAALGGQSSPSNKILGFISASMGYVQGITSSNAWKKEDIKKV